eukprot:669204-Prymnesium_polylepis.1
MGAPSRMQRPNWNHARDEPLRDRHRPQPRARMLARRRTHMRTLTIVRLLATHRAETHSGSGV